MRGRWQALQESVRNGFWAVPTLCVVLAVALALALVRVDRSLADDFGGRFTFGAGPDGAREVLSAITSSLITFTGLVFSITVVVLQLTSSQFSPRVLRTFLRDRLTQTALGVFVATFVYALLVLRTVDGGEEERFVPAVSTSVAVLLLLASVGLFVAYIHHITRTIQASSIIRSIGTETRRVLERVAPAGAQPGPAPSWALPGPPLLVVPAPDVGVLVSVDHERLVRAAHAADVVLLVRAPVGSFLPQGAPLVDVHGDPGGLDLAAVLAALPQARQRSMEQDLAFGLRQLVDIAERALSPGVNDPTTAVEALDELHDLLRRLVTRHLPGNQHRDEQGRVRLVTRPLDLPELLALALDEVEQYGADASQVRHRLTALLEDLAAAALPEHRDAVLQRRAAWTTRTGDETALGRQEPGSGDVADGPRTRSSGTAAG